MFNFLFSKKTVLLKNVFEEGKAAALRRNEEAVENALTELKRRLPENIVDGEALYGLLILTSCEFGLRCVGPHVGYFIQRFPDSISPVKIEMAGNLADQGQMDLASQYAREYLRVVHDGGHFLRLAQMPIAQRGTSRAFFLLSAAYTHCGARSRSKRIMKHALSLPTDSGFHADYSNEIERLHQELTDPAARAIDKRWEEFFASGKDMQEIAARCEKPTCSVLAKRVELIELNFRLRQDYRPSMEDEMLLVRQAASGRNTPFLLG